MFGFFKKKDKGKDDKSSSASASASASTSKKKKKGKSEEEGEGEGDLGLDDTFDYDSITKLVPNAPGIGGGHVNMDPANMKFDFGIVDDNVELTEDDFNDPELLAQLEAMGGFEEDEVAAVPQKKVIHVEEVKVQVNQQKNEVNLLHFEQDVLVEQKVEKSNDLLKFDENEVDHEVQVIDKFAHLQVQQEEAPVDLLQFCEVHADKPASSHDVFDSAQHDDLLHQFDSLQPSDAEVASKEPPQVKQHHAEIDLHEMFENDDANNNQIVPDVNNEESVNYSASFDLNNERIVSLKRQAILLNQEGKADEAIELLRKAKKLESINASISTVKSLASDDARANLKNSVADEARRSKRFSAVVVDNSNKQSKPQEVKQSVSSPSSNEIKSIDSPNVYPANSISKAPSSQAPRQDAAAGAGPGHAIKDMFTPLENALIEAMKHMLEEIQELKAKAPSEATLKFQKYKSLKAELDVIESRRNTIGAYEAGPPSFHWKTTTKKTEIVDNSLTDTQMKIEVEKACALEERLAGHSSMNMYVNIDIPFLKENQERKTPIVAYKNMAAPFHFSVVVDFKRGPTAIQSLAKRKVSFELWRQRGMFKDDESLGHVRLPLEQLLTHSEIGGTLDLTDGSSRKAIGGALAVRIKLRRPLTTPMYQEEIQRELIVGEWPQISTAAAKPPQRVQYDLNVVERADPLSPELMDSLEVLQTELQHLQTVQSTPGDHSSVVARQKSVNDQLVKILTRFDKKELTTALYKEAVKARIERDKILAKHCESVGLRAEAIAIVKRLKIMMTETTKSDDSIATLVHQLSPQYVKKVEKQLDFSPLSDAEKFDPLNVVFYISNDVLEAEIAALEAKLLNPKVSADEKSELTIRKLAMTTQLSLLVQSVQNETLSLPAYIGYLEERIQKDRLLAMFLQQNDNKPDAIQVMRRIKIMETEVKNAKENMEEEA